VDEILFVFPMNRNNAALDSDRPLTIFLVVLLLSAIVIRLLGFRYRLNADLVHFVIPWTRLIDEQGLTGLYEGISRQADWALGLLAKGGEGVAGIHNADRPVDVTYNYTPFYSYLLSLFGVLPFGEAVRVKIISVVFDVIMACGIYRIVRRNAGTRFEPRLAFSLTFLLPTVFMNSSWWGQMDAIFTAFLIWAVYFILDRRNLWACLFGGIALGVKFQPIFFAPVLLPLLLLRRLRLRELLNVITGYVATFVPAFFMGYPVSFVVLRYGANFLRSTHHWALGATAYSIFGRGPPEGASTPFLFICIVLPLLVSASVYVLHSRHLRETAGGASTQLSDADIIGVRGILQHGHRLLPAFHARTLLLCV